MNFKELKNESEMLGNVKVLQRVLDTDLLLNLRKASLDVVAENPELQDEIISIISKAFNEIKGKLIDPNYFKYANK